MGAYHFVGQDAVDAVVVQVDEPVEALHLVLAHDAVLDDAGLLHEAVGHMFAATHLILEQICILHLLCVLGAMPAPPLPAGGEGFVKQSTHSYHTDTDRKCNNKESSAGLRRAGGPHFFSFSLAAGAKCWKTSACFRRN